MKNKRIFNHKVFEGLANRGKSTMSYFYGFNLHIVVNEIGELFGFTITPENVDVREPLKDGNLLEKVYGKLFADKGYIGQEQFEMLFVNEIQLMTSRKRNMKSSLMNLMIVFY